jgi:DNA-binding response OmpR family regulator
MVARNGSEAMGFLETGRPDLVLLDIMMPDVDGYSICRHIKSTSSLKDIIVVFVSAKTAEADVQQGYELGAALYVSKPFSTRDLMKKINGLLQTG